MGEQNKPSSQMLHRIDFLCVRVLFTAKLIIVTKPHNKTWTLSKATAGEGIWEIAFTLMKLATISDVSLASCDPYANIVHTVST